MKPRPLLLCPFVAMALTVSGLNSHAALVLNVDPAALTITFSGSDVGTPNPNSGAGRVDWNSSFSLTNTSNNAVSINNAVNSTQALSDFTPSVFRLQGSAATPGFAIEIYTADATLQTLSGTGTPVSYASWTTSQQTDLANFAAAGNDFDLVFGGGFSSISTQLVPEPGVIGMLGAAGLLIGVFAARRRRSVVSKPVS